MWGMVTAMMWRTSDELIAWLAEQSLADQVRIARLLADTKTAGALRQFADKVVYDMTRAATYDDVAAALGQTRKQVIKAVERRNAKPST